MEIRETTQPLTASHSCLTGSTFSDVNLGETRFENVRLFGATFRDACLGNVTIEDASLENLATRDCNLTGMTINGIAVTELLRVYAESTSSAVSR